MKRFCKPALSALIAGLLAYPVAFAQQPMSAADKFAQNLQRSFKNQGYDIDVIAFKSDKTLRLTSDLFKNAETREDQARDLWRNRKALCAMDIWFVEVGYHKGTFSDDVAKKMSLGCPAQKAAHLQGTKPGRESFVSDLNSGFASNSLSVHASAVGSTLLLEGDLFSDLAVTSLFVKRMLSDSETMRKLCLIDFARIEVKNKKRVMKVAPIVCK